MGQSNQVLDRTTTEAEVFAELWISLGSLIRSYAAAHGLHNGIHAAIEIHGNRILAQHGKRMLELTRTGTQVIWRREDCTSGSAHLTLAGHLQTTEGETALDMAAEAWARDLMRESKQ